MTNRLELIWKLDGFVDEQRYYCSETPIDTANLPVPKAVLASHVRSYVDTGIELGNTYYVVVSSIKGNIEKVSQVIEVVAGGDPHWDKVVALLHFDGNLTDKTGRIWNLSGAPIIGGVGQFGGGITFSGDSSERVSSVCPAFGTDDWTVEMWVKFNHTSGQQNFFENLNSSWINPAGRLTIYQYFESLRVFIDSNDRVITPVPSTTEWHHLSVSCESGLVRMFVDGVIKGRWNSGGLNFDQTLMLFGAGFGTDSLYGSLDELRITKGVARYTTDFTPPDAPFPSY